MVIILIFTKIYWRFQDCRGGWAWGTEKLVAGVHRDVLGWETAVEVFDLKRL
jgi:hypothetical protein